MVQSVLGSLTLGYRPLWNGARQLAGIQLYVQDLAGSYVDAPHLLRTLQEMWSASSPPLLISPQSRQLLLQLLQQAPRGSPWIEVRGQWLGDSSLLEQVRQAYRRGLRLVWRGELSDLPGGDIAACFDNSLLSLSPAEAVGALQSSASTGQRGVRASPILDGQMYENLPTVALLSLCLDRHRAVAVAGWPSDDVLYSLRHQQLQPSHATIFKLMKAIDAEQSLDSFEHILSEDPLLAYRFLTYTNSAALGLRTGIDSLRRGLVMLGYGTLQRWLGDQLPHASTDPNLSPIRQTMVLRAQLMERLVEAGIEYELRREVYLTGLLSQLDTLMDEPIATILRRLPLSERISDAIVLRSGPYAPALQIACALETDDASVVRQLCETHEMDTESVNRALLRLLSELHVERPRPGQPTGSR
jgi:hypothetical protein